MMIETLVQKCQDTIDSNGVFGQGNLQGGRVFRDVAQYFDFSQKYGPGEDGATKHLSGAEGRLVTVLTRSKAGESHGKGHLKSGSPQKGVVTSATANITSFLEIKRGDAPKYGEASISSHGAGESPQLGGAEGTAQSSLLLGGELLVQANQGSSPDSSRPLQVETKFSRRGAGLSDALSREERGHGELDEGSGSSILAPTGTLPTKNTPVAPRSTKAPARLFQNTRLLQQTHATGRNSRQHLPLASNASSRSTASLLNPGTAPRNLQALGTKSIINTNWTAYRDK